MRRTISWMLMLIITLCALPVLAVPLLAQTGGIVLPDNAPAWMIILAPLLPILLGALASYAMDGLRLLSAKLDTAGTVVKRIVAVLLSLITTWIFTKFSVRIDPDLHSVTAESLIALFTVLANQGLFKQKEDKIAAAQGQPTITQQRLGIMPASARRI